MVVVVIVVGWEKGGLERRRDEGFFLFGGVDKGVGEKRKEVKEAF